MFWKVEYVGNLIFGAVIITYNYCAAKIFVGQYYIIVDLEIFV